MKTLNLVAIILLIIGGLNWGLVGLFQLDLVYMIFGFSFIARLVYILVGASAVWEIVKLKQILAKKKE